MHIKNANNNKHVSKHFLFRKSFSGFQLALVFVLGLAISGVAVYAATTMNASIVGFDNSGTSLSSTDVQGALDELYDKAKIVDNIPLMQTFNPSSLTSTGDSMTLIDARDGNSYTVKKLADGNVWMTQNLRIANKAITSADSDVSSNFTIPASSTSGFSAQDTNNAYVDSTYGGYYTFYTATAGTGGTSLTSGDAPSSICPKGWRLPTRTEFQTLYTNYNSASVIMGIPGFVLSGYVYKGSVRNQGSYGYYWSSTVRSAYSAYNLYLNSSSVDTVSNDEYSGVSVRCIARVPTMQDFDKTTLTNAGDSAVLEDARDHNTYTVKKLADGNVWMTENLRLINKTISSADSNLSEGETWTIPASSTSGFNSHDTNNAYLDSTYGGYYTFYTATAGWGTNSVTSGNAPKDICPKGWRLPTGGSSGEFQTLYNNYNSSALMQGVPNFVLSGHVASGYESDQGLNGAFWSSTVKDAYSAYLFYLASDVYPADSTTKFNGFSVRCIAI